MEIVFLNDDAMLGDEVITLKEITDILNVRHNDAMGKVTALSKEPSFGQLRKIRISYAKGKTVGTYVLNKVQAIAVGAKLNDKLLMKLVNKLEGLKNTTPLAGLVDMQHKSLIEFEDMKHKLQCMFEYTDKMGEVVTEHEKKLMDHDSKIENLQNNRRLENWMEKNISDAKMKRVYELANGDEKLAKKLHSRIWRAFKNRFHIPRYNELPVGHYEDGLVWLNNVQLHEVV